MIRVVLDTNAVLMPIARTTSSDIWLREASEQQHIVPLISSDTKAELIRTLRNPRLGISEEQITDTAAAYFDHCERVAIPDSPPETPTCRDPKDQMFLVLAYQAAADYLVTKDPDLLALTEESVIPIITPASLRVILQRQP
ncbi:MAG: putative toxin-antitoxin system toxin component, PIN family [Chloroflexi bacterium]|nr:putative toxin-antitoxin system toxin component, PIN family [Chloroflexota bacterium]MYD48761.1 putative toxin-antitoxin system toxin component, PIN family [Chloroflexota bacterium]